MHSTLSAAAGMMRASLLGEDREFAGVGTDTRTLRPNELFVALDGPNFEGSRFVSTAEEKGAAGVVVADEQETSLTQLVVDDTRRALGSLGAAWRKSLPTRVAGLTGSNGKTTLKEMLSSILQRVASTLATEGNLNNEIGVPLTLCRMSEAHQFAVIEMGANHAGEIAYLTHLASPEVVALTNAGAAHLEGFGSIEGVAHAKGEILKGSPRPKCAVLNADDQYFDLWSDWAAASRVLSFGIDSPADFRATNIDAGPDGSRFTLTMPGDSIAVTLPLSGVHNVLNATAAAAMAFALDVTPTDIRQGLEAVRPVAGRLRQLRAPDGTVVFDDSYNANPNSVVAAAEFLAARPGPSWFVLGDMGELGDEASQRHAEVGAHMRSVGVDRLLATGPLARNAVEAFGSGARWFADIDGLTAELTSALSESSGASILIKGSRSAGMERVVEALCPTESTGGGV